MIKFVYKGKSVSAVSYDEALLLMKQIDEIVVDVKVALEGKGATSVVVG